MVNNKISKTIYTDVLVIGGGGAGVWAAVEAVRAGAKVTVVSKGKVGNSGNTIMIGGSYSMDGDSAKNIYGWEGGDIELTRDFLLEQIIKQSFFLAEQDVAEQYVEDSPAVVYETYEWCKRAGQNQVFMPPGGWLVSGRGLGRGLLQGLKENPGAELIEDVMVLDLLTKNGNVIGALGVDVYTGEFIRFSAKAVIMATGGYQPFTIKNTNSDMTGDGMAMAYRAGADLADMEFHLFVPTAVEPEEFKGSLMPFIYEVFAGKSIPAIDEEGNPIVISKEMAEVAEGSELEKLVSTYYWSEAISEGRGFAGDTMYYDFSHMPDEVIKRGFEKMIGAMSQFYKPGYYHGDNIGVYRDFILANKKLKVGLIDEYTMGGIVITKDMETSLQGLFAAGEVGSGVFGACRIADATTEMMVQGSKAGKVAGAYIKNVDLVEPDESQIEEIIKNVTAPLGRNGGLCGAEIIHAIEKAADEGFGICRDEKGLSRALQELEHIEKDLLPNISVPCSSMRYNYDWIRSIQAKNLLTCTIAGVKAALLRKESRGFHMRHDYKKVNNDEWAVRIIIHKKEKEMELFTRKAKITKYEIPAGKETSIPAYIKNQDLNFKNVNFKE